MVEFIKPFVIANSLWMFSVDERKSKIQFPRIHGFSVLMAPLKTRRYDRTAGPRGQLAGHLGCAQFLFLGGELRTKPPGNKTTRFVKKVWKVLEVEWWQDLTKIDKTLLKIEEFTKAFINIAVDLPVDWDSVLLFRDAIYLQQQLTSQLFHAAHWWGWTMPSRRFDEAGWTHCRGCCQHCVTWQAVCGA